jgi:hypothetical protein
MKKTIYTKILLFKHRNTGLLDEPWYLSENSDVASSGADPRYHFFHYGVFENRPPNPGFQQEVYLKQFPKAAAFPFGVVAHYALYGFKTYAPIPPQPLTPQELLLDYWGWISPLPVYPVGARGKRITMVTSGIDSGSLFGGVGTALLFSALLANRLGATLRLVAQDGKPDASRLSEVLRANGMELAVPLELAHCPIPGSAPIAVSEADYFVATSWWTAHSLMGSVAPHRICYMLQEDERMFHAMGDLHNKCDAVLRDARVPLLINTQLLYDFLNHPKTGIGNLSNRAVWFEPAFPMASRPTTGAPDRPRKLLFYARPQHHARSMFYTGLEALHRAVSAGVFDPERWTFYFTGKDIPNIHFPAGPQVVFCERLDWTAYHNLVGQMDAGFSLMHSPHPSYIPLDLASKGAVSLTNTFGNKSSLEAYSGNIITANLDMPSLVDGLSRLEAAARNDQARLEHWERQRIGQDWSAAFEAALAFILPKV